MNCYNIDKIKSYVGFSIKSRQIIYGVDDIIKTKNTKLIIVSNSIAENALNKIKNYSLKNKVSYFELLNEDILKLIQNDKVKAFAILDKNLADAIKNNLTNC